MIKRRLIVLAATFLAGSAFAAAPAYPPQISSEGGVKVTATLQHINADQNAWTVEVSLETHTHALNERLEGVSELIADGRTYRPLSWEGAPPGGHHRKGLLRFPAVSPRPNAIELRIHLDGEASPRRFSWRLK